MLASEYGWSKRDILEDVYWDELPILVKQINKRGISNLRRDITVAGSPHAKNPKELWDDLDRKERELDGLSYLDDTKFDQAEMDRLRSAIQQHSHNFIVK